MYLKQAKINKFRILEDLDVNFQPPPGDGGNVVNVIAGVNGCGKTSVLQAIVEGFSSTKKGEIDLQVQDPPNMERTEPGEAQGRGLVEIGGWARIGNSLTKSYAEADHEEYGARVFFFHAHLSSEYHQISELTRKYIFVNRINTSTMLGNAEFFVREYVLAHERTSREPDPDNRAREAVERFNANFDGADLLTRLVDLDSSRFNRPVFENIRGERITIDQLSDGEKQLYGRVVALMIFEPRDSIILIDEPEISLHPRWQRVIMGIYARIGHNNQFIVATHSPQIISETPYQNLILMIKDPDTDHIQMVYQQHPPSGVDVNSVLHEVMGANPLPPEQLQFHRQYRELVEAGTEDSAEGRALREKILRREAETSQFLQEMQFLAELRYEG